MGLCPQLTLARLMAEDAKRVARATAHWRDGPGLGRAPAIKGKFRPGSIPDRLSRAMVCGRCYTAADCAQLANVSRQRAREALKNMVKAGAVVPVAEPVAGYVRRA